MFERYTEKSRRVIFFARFEAAQFGSPFIETEHLLLGICRESRPMLARMLGSDEALRKLEEKLRQRPATGCKMSTSVDLPLTNECKRVLAYAAEESVRLSHRHIGVEHLLVGLLREKGCEAARALTEFGLTLEHGRAVAQEEGDAVAHEAGGEPVGAQPVIRHALHGSFLELVEHGSGERLDVWQLQPLAPVPRIGEEVVLREGQHPLRRFRVVNVAYEFDGSRLHTVRLSVEPLPRGSGEG
jgi:ATP-dependent Clp protease ATP-binding subunit ClpC